MVNILSVLFVILGEFELVYSFILYYDGVAVLWDTLYNKQRIVLYSSEISAVNTSPCNNIYHGFLLLS